MPEHLTFPTRGMRQAGWRAASQHPQGVQAGPKRLSSTKWCALHRSHQELGVGEDLLHVARIHAARRQRPQLSLALRRLRGAHSRSQRQEPSD